MKLLKHWLTAYLMTTYALLGQTVAKNGDLSDLIKGDLPEAPLDRFCVSFLLAEPVRGVKSQLSRPITKKRRETLARTGGQKA
jgi:hypothetical protein